MKDELTVEQAVAIAGIDSRIEYPRAIIEAVKNLAAEVRRLSGTETGDRSLDAVPPLVPSCPDVRARAERLHEELDPRTRHANAVDILTEALSEAWVDGYHAGKAAT